MVCLQIADIYLKMSEQDFEKELQDYQDNYSYQNITHECNQLRMQKSGQEMLQVIIKNDNGSTFTIVGERDSTNGDVVFKPTKIRSMNKSFFQTSYADPDDVGEDHDPSMFFSQFMVMLAKNNSGIFAFQDATGHMGIVKDGKDVEVESLAIADDKGNIYTIAGAQTIGAVYEDSGSKFHIKKFWKDWLQENPDVGVEVGKVQEIPDKLTLLAKILIQKKLNEEIDFDEFQDIFIQICSYGVISDNTVLNFYKLLK